MCGATRRSLLGSFGSCALALHGTLTVTPTLLQAAKEELISSVPQRSLASALRETLLRPYAPHSATANILLNADRNSRFTHAELTKAHVRLEFSDASSPTYQALALTYLGVSEEGGDSRVRKMITGVRNHAMGAGCTVWLDRDAVTEFVMAEGDEEVTRDVRGCWSVVK